MENKTNKIVEHIANKKGVYGGLISLLGLFGVVLMFNPFNSPEGGSLTGNVEELFNDDGALNVLFPADGIEVEEGDSLELVWEYADALATTTYRILVAREGEAAEAVAGGISANSYLFDIPYDTVSAEEVSANFMLQVVVEQTGDVYAGPTVTLNHVPGLVINAPLDQSEFSEGDVLEINWDYPNAIATTTYGVSARAANDPEAEVIVIEEGVSGNSTQINIDHESVTEQEGAKEFILTVGVNGTSIEESINLTINNKEQFEFNNVQEEGENQLENEAEEQNADLEQLAQEENLPEGQLDLGDELGPPEAGLDLGEADDLPEGELDLGEEAFDPVEAELEDAEQEGAPEADLDLADALEPLEAEPAQNNQADLELKNDPLSGVPGMKLLNN